MPKNGIVAFAFGIPGSITSNRTISAIASKVAKEHQAPIFTQKGLINVDQGLEVEFVKEKITNPAATLDIARQAVTWAIQRGIQELWIVAALPHMWRCVRDLDFAVREAQASIIIRIASEVSQYASHTWFCTDSEQTFHRDSKRWERSDHILRIMPMWIYVYLYTPLRRLFAP